MTIEITIEEWLRIQELIGIIHNENDEKPDFGEKIDKNKIRQAYEEIDEIMSRAIDRSDE